MDNVSELCGRLVSGLAEIFGSALVQVVLYGSTARGTQTDESDVDVAVLVRSCTEKMHERMIDLAVDLELEYGRVLSVLPIDYAHFSEWEAVLPFYRNVREEGILLWKAA